MLGQRVYIFQILSDDAQPMMSKMLLLPAALYPENTLY